MFVVNLHTFHAFPHHEVLICAIAFCQCVLAHARCSALTVHIFCFFLTEKECGIVRNLPIFSSYQASTSEAVVSADGVTGDSGDGGNGGSASGGASGGLPGGRNRTSSDGDKYVGSFVAIGDRIVRNSSNTTTAKGNRAPYATVVDYTHLPSSILPSHLLRHSSTLDLQLLTHLQVTVLTRAQYYRTEFLPSVQYLYTVRPVECVRTILCMCDEVKVLSEGDKEFMSVLRSAAFIPCATSIDHITSRSNISASGNSSGASSRASSPTGFASPNSNVNNTTTISSATTTTTATSNPTPATSTRLRRACELFDPSDHELTALLDIQCFPNALLVPVLQRPELLVLLKSVGLQTSLNWPAIVACAR